MYETNSFYAHNNSTRSWKKGGDSSTGALLPESDTQVFWLCAPGLSEPIDVHAVKEGALSTLPAYVQRDYTIAIAPFDFGGNKCAVLQDACGRRLCLIEKGNSARVIS